MKTIVHTALRRMLCAACAVLLAGGLAATSAQAQGKWLKTVQIITPIESDGITGALLDTLVQVIDRNDVMVRRTPEEGEPELGLRTLEDGLLDEGLDFYSASHMFITYKYEATQLGLNTEIVDMYFIFRADDTDEADIPIFYLDASHPVVRNTLRSSGTQLLNNEAAFTPFWDQLMINRLTDGAIIAVGGRIIRDPNRAKMEKQRLLATIRRFMY